MSLLYTFVTEVNKICNCFLYKQYKWGPGLSNLCDLFGPLIVDLVATKRMIWMDFYVIWLELWRFSAADFSELVCDDVTAYFILNCGSRILHKWRLKRLSVKQMELLWHSGCATRKLQQQKISPSHEDILLILNYYYHKESRK